MSSLAVGESMGFRTWGPVVATACLASACRGTDEAKIIERMTGVFDARFTDAAAVSDEELATLKRQVKGLEAEDDAVTFALFEGAVWVVPFAVDDSVAEVCFAFGEAEEARCVPADSADLLTTDMGLSLEIPVPNDICDDVRLVCHDIPGYRFTRDEAGDLSAPNLLPLASACGRCNEPLCERRLAQCRVADTTGYCLLDDECGDASACSHGECVRVGELRFTLSWSASTDLDLHVLTPSGEEVWFRNTTGGGGELDQDDPSGEANAAENIWFDTASSGTYAYWIQNYDGENPAVWTLDVYRDGLRVEEHIGVMTGVEFAESERWTIDVP